MTAADKLALLTAWQAAIELSDAQIDPIIEVLGLTPDSDVCNAVWGLQDKLTRMTAAAIGDATELLSWHACENNWGRRALEIEGRPVRTLEDLLIVIGEGA